MAKKSSQSKQDYVQTLNPQGYVHNDEVTNLPDNYLVYPSQNCLIENKQKVVQGVPYELLGPTRTVNKAPNGSYDWVPSSGPRLSLKAYDDELEVFHDASSTFKRLKNLWVNTNFNFAPWWNNTELLDVLLMVNGGVAVYEWSGGIAEIASVTAATITMKGYTSGTDYLFTEGGASPDTITKASGGFTAAGFAAGDQIVIAGSTLNDATYTIGSVTDTVITLDPADAIQAEAAGASVVLKRPRATFGESRFFSVNTRAIRINDVEYTYTGGETTGTLTGVSPSPIAAVAAGDIGTQAIRQYTPAALASTSTDLISVLNNHVFFASTVSRVVKMSKSTDFTDVAESTPRAVTEGATFTLDSPPTAFDAGTDTMIIHGGRNDLYRVTFTLSSDNTKEAISVKKKSSSGLAAQSQSVIINTKDDIISDGAIHSTVYLSFDRTIDSLSRVLGSLTDTLKATPISDPIKLHMDTYNFTGAHGLYFDRKLFLAVPRETVLLIYDFVDQLWQPPQTLPVGRLAIIEIDGVDTLCAYASNCNETYKLYSGLSHAGSKYMSIVAFGYDNEGYRFTYKNFDEIASELYLTRSTVMNERILYDFGGATGTKTFNFDPASAANANRIFAPSATLSLGSSPLGYSPLGSPTDPISNVVKARPIHLTDPIDYFEKQRIFYTDSQDAQYAIIARGENVTISENLPAILKQ